MKQKKYMMATKAYHKLGDISRDCESLCCITEENNTHYIGYWVEGLGFFGVRFPKETTRELTEEEIQYWNGKMIAIGTDNFYKIEVG